MQRIVVVGLGRLGRAVAEALTAAGADVLAVDERLDEVERARDAVAAAVQADASDPQAMEAAGARGAAAAVVAIGEDFEASVLATSVLRELGVPRVVARAGSAREERILKLVGATETLSVEREVGGQLAKRLVEAMPPE